MRLRHVLVPVIAATAVLASPAMPAAFAGEPPASTSRQIDPEDVLSQVSSDLDLGVLGSVFDSLGPLGTPPIGVGVDNQSLGGLMGEVLQIL
ncbi:hypothetical protein [Yinghuangia seranimata]|uniref:hypothetical protein n=1 Tax=Yinghuangia seranimata TaxID=408067 RepID=UPI00248B386D|nr:hypothetical protein [Yinghuangia seranimata]MDI2129061.1 hypothetical protein [Yinghuangia seranimata]